MPRQYFYLFILFCFSLSIGSAVFAEAELIGYVKLSGEKHILRKSAADTAWQLITNGSEVYEGDSLKMAPNTIAKVSFISGKEAYLPPKQAFFITAKEAQASFYERIRSFKFFAFLFQSDSPESSSPRGNYFTLLTAKDGKVLSTTPNFSWSAPSSNGKFQLSLSLLDGQDCLEEGDLVWAIDSQGFSLDFPEDQSPLLPGRHYQLFLTQVTENSISKGCFQVAAPGEAEQVMETLSQFKAQYSSDDPADISVALVSGAFLIDQEYYGAALDTLKRAHQVQPTNELLVTLLKNLGDKADIAEWIEQFFQLTEQ